MQKEEAELRQKQLIENERIQKEWYEPQQEQLKAKRAKQRNIKIGVAIVVLIALIIIPLEINRANNEGEAEMKKNLAGTWKCDGVYNPLILNYDDAYIFNRFQELDFSIIDGNLIYNPREGYVVLKEENRLHKYMLINDNGILKLKMDSDGEKYSCVYSSTSTVPLPDPNSSSAVPSATTYSPTSALNFPSGAIIGTWLDTWAWTRTIVIKRVNGTYQMTSTYSDGNRETISLGVKVINGEERLYENPGNLYGDYMVIKSNGNLAFYDDQGFIYEIPPK